MTTRKPSADDFERAADWLRYYDGGTDDTNNDAMQRVADYLDRLAAKDRYNDALQTVIRNAAAQTGRDNNDPELRRIAKRALDNELKKAQR